MTITTTETRHINCPGCGAAITFGSDDRGLLRTNKHVCGMVRVPTATCPTFCAADWDATAGDEPTRFCTDCGQPEIGHDDILCISLAGESEDEE